MSCRARGATHGTFILLRRRLAAKECYNKGDLHGARALFEACLRSIRGSWRCSVASPDIQGVMHANLAEICTKLHKFPFAKEHANETIRLCPAWERGCFAASHPLVPSPAVARARAQGAPCFERAHDRALAQGIRTVVD